MTTRTKQEKQKKLRNNEYYNFQNIQDRLYKQSSEGKNFRNLMTTILSRENILLAYRNIKKNKGSRTPGVNKNTIVSVGEIEPKNAIAYVRNRLEYFTPHKVRRKEVEKEGGGVRPLGIPTIEDRLIQQCIKQVLEPICEAKFYKHSYGFRPNRSTGHVIARAMFLMNMSQMHYIVELDIKSFFDNVDHGKLLKQIWAIGIRDKKLLSIISAMMKAEIIGIGIPSRGVPQGGVLCPLLANIVLNELDWWISNQWQYMKTRHKYKFKNAKYKALKKTALKEMYIVRYADYAKIFCRNAKTAQKAFAAVKDWLKERLNLDISPKKSKVVNVRKNYSNFLGFKLKVKPKKNKYVVKSHVSEKTRKKIIKGIIEEIKTIKKNPSAKTVNNYNSKIIGWHNYYKIATHVSYDFREIAFLVKRALYNGTRSIRSSTGTKTEAFERLYGDYNFKVTYIAGVALFPIRGIRTKHPMCFQRGICQYSAEGRTKIHSNLKRDYSYIIGYFLRNPELGRGTEYNDNRISLYIGQDGKCAITKQPLRFKNMHIHRKIPTLMDGLDSYNNLIYVIKDIDTLIHAVDYGTIELYMEKLKLNKKALAKLNELRKLVGNCVI